MSHETPRLPEDSLTPGNKVGILRKELKQSQEQFAQILGVSRGTISAYENRPNASPGPSAIRELSRLYNIDFNWFYDGKEGPPKSKDSIPARTSSAEPELPTEIKEGYALIPRRVPLHQSYNLGEGMLYRWDESDEETVNPFALTQRGVTYRAVRWFSSSLGSAIPSLSTVFVSSGPSSANRIGFDILIFLVRQTSLGRLAIPVILSEDQLEPAGIRVTFLYPVDDVLFEPEEGEKEAIWKAEGFVIGLIREPTVHEFNSCWPLRVPLQAHLDAHARALEKDSSQFITTPYVLRYIGQGSFKAFRLSDEEALDRALAVQ